MNGLWAKKKNVSYLFGLDVDVMLFLLLRLVLAVLIDVVGVVVDVVVAVVHDDFQVMLKNLIGDDHGGVVGDRLERVVCC